MGEQGPWTDRLRRVLIATFVVSVGDGDVSGGVHAPATRLSDESGRRGALSKEISLCAKSYGIVVTLCYCMCLRAPSVEPARYHSGSLPEADLIDSI